MRTKLFSFFSFLFFFQAVFSQFSWEKMNTVYPAGVDNRTVNFSITNDNVIWGNFWNDLGKVAFTKSTDFGNTWTVVPNVATYTDYNFRVTDFFALSENVAFLGTTYQDSLGRGRLYKTTDGGVIWNLIKNFDTNVTYVHFWDANTGIVVCYPNTGVVTASKKIEIFQTTDGGVTWTPKGGSLLINSQPNQTPRYIRDDWRDSFWFGSSGGEMIKTNDRGATWTVTQTSYDSSHFGYGNKSLGHFVITDANTAFFTDYNTGKLYKTTDGFVTEQYIGDPGLGKQTYLEKIPDTNILLATGSSFEAGSVRGSKYSTDGGLTWNLINNIGRAFVKSKGSNMTFAYGWDGTGGYDDYWRIVKLNVKSLGTGSEFENDIFSIYPVPTGNTLYVNSKIIIDSFTIWDSAGRMIWQGKNDNNKIDVSRLAKGTYHISVLHKGKQYYRKFIKE